LLAIQQSIRGRAIGSMLWVFQTICRRPIPSF
jgi:hypothetical protein